MPSTVTALEFGLQLLWTISDNPLNVNPDPPVHFMSETVLPFLNGRRKLPMNASEFVRDMGFVAAIEVEQPDELRRRITLSGDGAWPHLPRLGFMLRRNVVEQFEQCTISVMPPPSEPEGQSPQYLVADISPWAFAADRVGT